MGGIRTTYRLEMRRGADHEWFAILTDPSLDKIMDERIAFIKTMRDFRFENSRIIEVNTRLWNPDQKPLTTAAEQSSNTPPGGCVCEFCLADNCRRGYLQECNK